MVKSLCSDTAANAIRGGVMTRVATGNVAGVLLYAKTDETVTQDDDFNIGGNPISIKTLDLNQDWAGITGHLESLCGWLEVESHA